ncbi:Isopenicillin N synthase [Sphingomonas laterariae]|uniref:2-oxoglutarate-dependent ethylene/succinate-forming enzyme n=1 Tax=Edaphosphingomonas laterariae TaxID=861865 RepID=A0A239JMX6_9SPHN|nr:2-oxoglutarate and iron-dependent oxygenase domain-containing protein [Sphingomonas laterariae]SNT06798.1 Isopenicillin N synthase [Sphingomonas laterariae]
MTTISADRDHVASVSLATAAHDPQDFATRLGQSFERHGFAIVADHGIDADVIARADAAARAFFALPDAVKRQYHLPGTGGARGYTPFGLETAKDATQSDLKEFWHVGRALPAGHAFAPYMPANPWPAEVMDFHASQIALFDAFDATGGRLLAAIAHYLGIDAGWMADSVRDGNSVLRLLHYPPVSPDAPGIRAGAHEDINTITLLLGAEEAGLELLTRDGQWLAVKPKPGELVVNVGDMLQRLTNNVLRSTTHRVRNPATERRGFSRYSMPFFLHFRPDFLIETLPGCMSAERPDHYPQPITANDYLTQRLREIKLL